MAKRPVHVMLGFFEEQADTLAEIANYVRHLRIRPRSFEELANCQRPKQLSLGELAEAQQLCRASLENDRKRKMFSPENSEPTGKQTHNKTRTKRKAQRFALAACCHADQPTKRDNVFERKKALKRNVATRQPARFVGTLLTFIIFAKPVESQLNSQQN